MTIQEWFRDGVQYDSEGTQIWAEERTKDAVYLHHVADIRGWGEMQNLFKLDMNKAAAFQDEVGKFVAEAINEKLAKQKLNIHSVMQAEASGSAQGAAVGQRSVGEFKPILFKVISEDKQFWAGTYKTRKEAENRLNELKDKSVKYKIIEVQ